MKMREREVSTFPVIAEMQFELCFHRGSCDFQSPGRDAKMQNDTLFRHKSMSFCIFLVDMWWEVQNDTLFRFKKCVFCIFAPRPGDWESHEPLCFTVSYCISAMPKKLDPHIRVRAFSAS